MTESTCAPRSIACPENWVGCEVNEGRCGWTWRRCETTALWSDGHRQGWDHRKGWLCYPDGHYSEWVVRHVAAPVCEGEVRS
jgi:hypothetical protein